jgi:hypothetical protein
MSEALRPLSGTTTISQTNTAQRVRATSQVMSGVALKRETTNAGTVYIGDSTVDANGWPLTEPVGADVVDLAAVYVYGTAGDKIRWFGLVV